MFAPEGERFGRQARRLRLNTLIGLRWLAVAGQTAAILISAFGLGLRFPVLACLTLVAASAALNLALRWRLPVSLQLSERAATGLLAYDILQLAGLLFLTGGVANPFVILFLAPVTIAATSLSLRNALALLGLALVCATALLRASLPLPWIGGESLVLPPLYVLARWVALAVSAAFVTLYAYRVAQEARHTASALTATELVLARAQHLSQIDGLAAAAAHELGTPLATIALVVREMAAHPPQGEEFIDDLRLLEQSVDQCRSILGKLSSPSELSGQPMDLTSPVELAEIAAAPHRLLGVTIAVEGEGSGPAPKCPAQSRCLVRPRQPDRERGQFRGEGGRHSHDLEPVDGQDRDRRRRARLSPAHAGASGRTLSLAARRRPAQRGNRRRARAWPLYRPVAARTVRRHASVRQCRGPRIGRRRERPVAALHL